MTIWARFDNDRTDNELLADLRNHAAVLHVMGNHEQAEQLLNEMVEISHSVYSVVFNPMQVIAAYQNGLGYADVSDLLNLEKAIASLKASLQQPGMDARHQNYELALTANLAIRKGDYSEAARKIDQWPSILHEWSHIYRLQMRISGMQDDDQTALWKYNLLENDIASRGYGVPAYPTFFAEHARAPYEVARMFDDRNGPGDREEAIRRYETALEKWDKAGADFRYVQLTKDRLAELRN